MVPSDFVLRELHFVRIKCNETASNSKFFIVLSGAHEEDDAKNKTKKEKKKKKEEESFKMAPKFFSCMQINFVFIRLTE